MFIYLFIYTFSLTHLQVRPVDGFSSLMAQTTRTRARMCILGVSLILLLIFWGEIPKTQFFGRGMNRKSKTGNILKVSFYQNYCIDFNQIQIRVNDRDHQGVIMGGPNRRPTNPRWRTAAILKKNIKSPYLCDRSTDFDEIWHADSHWSVAADQSLKCRIFENPRWQRPPS